MNTTLPRRDFLKLAAAASATVLLPAPLAAAEDAPPKKRRIKKAIMGATIGLQGSLVEKYKALKAAGFEGVEPMSHMNQDDVVKALEESGLKAASVCCSTHWRLTLSHPDPAAREKGLEGLRQALRDAKRYGATSVLLVPGVAREGVTYEQCWERSIAEIRRAIPIGGFCSRNYSSARKRPRERSECHA